MIDTGLLVVLKGNLKKTRTKKNQKNDQHKALSSAHSELKKTTTKRSKPKNRHRAPRGADDQLHDAPLRPHPPLLRLQGKKSLHIPVL